MQLLCLQDVKVLFHLFLCSVSIMLRKGMGSGDNSSDLAITRQREAKHLWYAFCAKTSIAKADKNIVAAISQPIRTQRENPSLQTAVVLMSQ